MNGRVKRVLYETRKGVYAVRYIYVFVFAHAALYVSLQLLAGTKCAHVAHSYHLSGTHLEKVPLYGIHPLP